MRLGDGPYPEAVQAAIAHAVATPGLEACGLIVRPPLGPVRYIPARNAHSRPAGAFRIAAADWPLHTPILAVVHSHPRQAVAQASAADCAGQQAMRLPWLIIATGAAPSVLWVGHPDVA